MSDKRGISNRQKFFYNGILLTAVGIAMRTVALFFNAFLTREVGAEGIGLYTLVMTVYSFAVTFATSGISLTVTRLVAAAMGEGERGEVSRVLSGAVLYALIFSTAATVALFFGAAGFAQYVLFDARGAACLRILSPSLIPLSLVSVFSGYFVGVRRVGCNAATQIFGQLFKIGITVWLVTKVSHMGVEYSAVALSLGTTLTEIICFGVIFIQFLIDRRRAEKKSGAQIKGVAEMAIPLALSAYIRQALLTLEHILIPKRLQKRGESNSEALSSYGTLHGMALPMILYPMATLSSFAGLLVPEFAERMARNDERGMRKVASEAFSLTLIYAVATSAFLLIFSEELGYVIYNSYSAGRYIAVLAPVVPIMYLDHVTDSVLKGVGEQVYSMWVNITDSLLSIFLVWFLIPRMGIMGYALCIVIMEGYNFVLSAIRLLARIKFRISFTKSLVFPLIAACVSAFLVKNLFLPEGSGATALWLALKLVFSACAFFVIFKLLCLAYDAVTKAKRIPKR